MRVIVYQASDTVALLAEGVDRNLLRTRRWTMPAVALLAEGVDRNQCSLNTFIRPKVALLAEGVDRNVRLREPMV